MFFFSRAKRVAEIMQGMFYLTHPRPLLVFIFSASEHQATPSTITYVLWMQFTMTHFQHVYLSKAKHFWKSPTQVTGGGGGVREKGAARAPSGLIHGGQSLALTWNIFYKAWLRLSSIGNALFMPAFSFQAFNIRIMSKWQLGSLGPWLHCERRHQMTIIALFARLLCKISTVCMNQENESFIFMWQTHIYYLYNTINKTFSSYICRRERECGIEIRLPPLLGIWEFSAYDAVDL